MVSSDVPEAYQAVPATRVDQVRVVWVVLAGENFVSVGRFKQLMADLLNFGHSCFIVDLDVGLRTSYAEVLKIISIVNCVKTIFFVKAEMFNRVSQILSPADNRTIKTSPK